LAPGAERALLRRQLVPAAIGHVADDAEQREVRVHRPLAEQEGLASEHPLEGVEQRVSPGAKRLAVRTPGLDAASAELALLVSDRVDTVFQTLDRIDVERIDDFEGRAFDFVLEMTD